VEGVVGKVRSAAPAFLFASLLIGLSTRADDPLPLVQPKAATPVAETPQASSGAEVLAMPRIVLAVYPLRDLAAIATVDTSDPSALRKILRESVAANDQQRFDAALTRAKSVAETLPAGEERNALRHAVSVYSDLQQVWSYASADKYGAFYDDQSLPGMHARLTGSYSGYAGYISQFSLTDDRGRVFYPTAEARTFLVRQAGGSVPQTAERAPVTRPAKPASSARRTATTPAAAPAPAVTHHKRLHKAESTPQPAVKASPVPVSVAATQPPPAAVAATPASATVAPATVHVASATPAPVVATPAPAPVAVSSAPTPAPVAVTPATTPAPAASANPPAATPDVYTSEIHRAANPPVTPMHALPAKLAEAGARQTTQGLLFIIVALVAIGVMTIWARTPQAASQPPQIFKPSEPLASGESPTPKKPEGDVVQIKQNRAS
jgi:hypothetical protein